MGSKPPLSDFLAALPALLQAVSQRVLRALVVLGASVARFALDTAIRIADFFVHTAKLAWQMYCRLELSIVDALATVMIILWSLRLFALLLAPAVVLAVLRYWIAASAYLAVLGLAIWRFYSAKAEDIERAAEDQAPVRALLVRILRWGLRALMIVITIISFGITVSSSSANVTATLKDQWSRLFLRPSDSPSTIRDTVSGRQEPKPVVATRPFFSTQRHHSSAESTFLSSIQESAPTSKGGSGTLRETASIDVDRVYAVNLPSIRETLTMARSALNTEVESSAKTAARAYDFGAILPTVARNRKTARPLNDEARKRFAALGADNDPSRYRSIVEVQRRAFVADSADIEIAGNLAVYLLQAGDPTSALKYAIYAMALPRSSESTGRTADWSTVAAALASIGDHDGAANALFVTLAISTDVKKRCEVAVTAARKTYGRVLRPATEALLQRVRERQLSEAFECSLPIAW